MYIIINITIFLETASNHLSNYIKSEHKLGRRRFDRFPDRPYTVKNIYVNLTENKTNLMVI